MRSNPTLEQTMERTASLLGDLVDKVRVTEKALIALEEQMHAQSNLVLDLQQRVLRHDQMEKITERHLGRLNQLVWQSKAER